MEKDPDAPVISNFSRCVEMLKESKNMLFQCTKRWNKRKKIIYGFPKELHDDVLTVLKVIPKKAYVPKDISYYVSTYILSSGEIHLPGQVYFYEPTIEDMYSLTERQQTILHCIYSRSHDGYMREKHITAILSTDLPEWTLPYIVKVCEESVIDILKVVYASLEGKDTEQIKQFCANNYESFYQSYNRMISYWNAFYRNDCYEYKDYIGRKLFIECFGAKRKMKPPK